MTAQTENYLSEGEFSYEEDRTWAKYPDGWTWQEGAGVAIDENDNVYFLNRGEHPVIVFDKAGNMLRSFGGGFFTGRAHALHISCTDGSLWAVDDSHHSVHRMSREGELLQTIGEMNTPAPAFSQIPFNRPTDVEIGQKTGDVFISDGYGNSAVHRFSPEGKLIKTWGEPGVEPGQFQLVHNLVMDADENIFVCDRENDRIQVFNNEGKVIDIWHDIYRPSTIAMDAQGRFYIGELNQRIAVESLGHRITILDHSGHRLARLGSPIQGDEPGQFIAFHGMAVDSQGNIFGAEVSWTMRGRLQEPPRTYHSFRVLRRK